MSAEGAASDFTFRADRYGYMLFYKGEPIGGVGTLKRGPMHWRHARANVRMFAEDARRAIAELDAGLGEWRYRTVIHSIDKKKGTP